MEAKLEFLNFKQYLQEELVSRCRKNQKYSLRAFAKSLQVSPSALSDMLNGRRNITARSIEKFGFILGLSLNDIEGFKKIQHDNLKKGLRDEQFKNLSIDQFSFIADWYHYAILELIKVKDFESSPTWISKALGITVSEVNIAIERLVRLKQISIDESGNFIDCSLGFTSNISPQQTSAASKQLQKQILEQSISALEKYSIEERNHTSMTMAIDPNLLPEAIDRIKTFRRDLCYFLESKGKATEVYQLALSLFPVTEIKKLKSGENI